ncbi:MAG: biotin/lipoyl-containing protein, partial [Bacteroidota bacterium]
LGQPYGGFPKDLQKIILKDEKPIQERANKYLKPVDFEVEFSNFLQKFGSYYDFEDFLSYKLYPKVFQGYHEYISEFGDVSYIPTLAYLYGLKVDEEVFIRLDEGKTLIIRLLYIKEPDDEGNRRVTFELNGQVRAVVVRDRNIQVKKVSNRKINTQNEGEIGAPLQGKLADIMAKPGDQIKENSPLFVIEAMKMETIISAPKAGKIEEIILEKGAMVEQDDLVLIVK